jgi:glyoxylase-like metal-dependent hydrolase (beta-lactamase superfamily II)
MADERRRLDGNVEGPWFVDASCIDCDAVRQIAPTMFGREGRFSIVTRQPSTSEEETLMWRAVIACPTRSVRRAPPLPRPRGLYPWELGGGVHLTGHNAESSFGANAFFVTRPEGNLLVDAPRWTRELVDAFDAAGGIDHVLLTHRDDVADAGRYADRFGARVWIHAADAAAAPFATDVVDGLDPVTIRPGLELVPIPGHTRGSVAFVLEDRVLFSGDSLYWSRTRQDLAVHVHATWYSLDVQIASLARLAEQARFSWVLAGHGDRAETTHDDMHRRLLALVERHRR